MSPQRREGRAPSQRATRYLATASLALACLASLACPANAPPEAAAIFEQPPAPEPARAAVQPARVGAPSDYLEGALLEASFDANTLARVLASLPRPSPNGSELVALVGAVIDVFAGVREQPERAEALVADTGLDPAAPIHMSVRALDGRFAAVAKRLAELSGDGGGPPEQLELLASQAQTLGLHMRASLPTRDPQRLLAVLEGVLHSERGRAAGSTKKSGQDTSTDWATQCAELDGTQLCSGWPRLLAWAREAPDAAGHPAVRVDMIYLFYAGASEAELRRAIARADSWSPRASNNKGDAQLDAGANIEMRMHSAGTLALLRAEALADAATQFSAAPSPAPYPAYLDRERALRELHPPERLFDGLALALDYEPDTDALDIEMRWLPTPGRETLSAELFAPVNTRPGMPSLRGVCERALACARFGGLSSLLRYAPLAEGAFSDLTGASRVLRQAGERGQVMLLLGAWPHVLGTGAVLAGGGRGMVAEAQAAVLGDSDGLGFVVQELGTPASPTSPEQWAAYLRLSSAALHTLRPAAALAGVSLQPLELPNIDLRVDSGAYEDTAIYFVEEEESAWIMAASEAPRVSELLTCAREINEQLEPLWFMRFAALGEIAVEQELAYSDDPPVRRWLDEHALELRGDLHPSGPQLSIELRARAR